MSRIRSVHPGLFTDGDFVCLSDSAQIFFIGLLTEADDYGAFEWKPVTLKLKLRGASTSPVEPLLAELEAAERVKKYEYDGREYGVIRNFTRYQRPKFPKSSYFIPPELRRFAGSTDPITEIDRVDEPPVPPKAEISPQMEDGGGRRKGREEEKIPPDPPKAELLEFEFGEFWKAYPRRDDRGHALKAYRAARKSVEAEVLVLGARRYAAERRGKDPQFTSLASTWLAGQRWGDEGQRHEVPAFGMPGFA